MAFQSLLMPGDDDRWLDAKLAEPLFSAWNGYGSAPMGLTGIDDDIYAAASVRNRGLGAAFLAQDTLGADLMTIDDIGTSLTNLFGSGTADITGDTLLRALLDVQGAGTFESTLHGVGAVQFDDILDVGGDGTFDANVDIAGDLTVAGNVVIGETLDVTGAVVLRSTLAVLGTVVLGDAPGDVIAMTGTATFAQIATFALGLVTTTGGITFTASTPGQRILADFTNATVVNRTLFQTSVVNGLTDIGALPNGTGAGAAMTAYSVVNPAASARLNLYAAPASHYLLSTHTGASFLPLEINVGGLAGQVFAANGDIVIGSGTAIKIGFFGGAGATIQTVEDAATDLASAIDLANNLRDIVLAYSLAET